MKREDQLTSDFKPGMTVIIRDYPNPENHDSRTGQRAVVTAIDNKLVTVNRGGYVETFIPSRLDILPTPRG